MIRRLVMRLRASLALRIYLFGIAQMAIVAIGFATFAHLTRPDFQKRMSDEDIIASRVSKLLGSVEAVRGELERAREEQDVTITVTDPSGLVVATTTPPEAPPCAFHGIPADSPPNEQPKRPAPQEGKPPPPHPGPMCRIAALSFPSGELGRIEFRPIKPPGPPSPFGWPIIILVMVVVAISSFVMARSFARPLNKLSRAAQALGQGDLSARADSDRIDELGQVSRAFDEMAGRVKDLLQAERELVANVSHELRTPMARIRVALDIASEGDASAARESLEEIASDVSELEQLVDDILTAARLDHDTPASSRGIPPIERRSVDMCRIAQDTASRLRVTHGSRRIDCLVPEGEANVEGDHRLLQRVAQNLLDNALKYSDERKDEATTITVECTSNDVLISVRDRGAGIALDDQPLIFEPFFRADRSRTRATGGHGLGLALVKRIVAAHGGTISVDSTLGVGTTVQVRLSRAPVSAADQ